MASKERVKYVIKNYLPSTERLFSDRYYRNEDLSAYRRVGGVLEEHRVAESMRVLKRAVRVPGQKYYLVPIDDPSLAVGPGVPVHDIGFSNGGSVVNGGVVPRMR